MENIFAVAGQPMRSEAERANLTLLKQMDEARDALRKDAYAHPAIMATLNSIEMKLDELLSRLK